jgi:hypothetical protein
MKRLIILFLTCLIIIIHSKPVPFKECNTGTPIFKKHVLDISPDDIRQGTVMVTRTNETASEPISGGVNINFIYFLGIQIGTERYDICESTIGGCPIRGNFASESKSTIPRFSPKGTYKVIARERDLNGREISCIEFEFKVV